MPSLTESERQSRRTYRRYTPFLTEEWKHTRGHSVSEGKYE